MWWGFTRTTDFFCFSLSLMKRVDDLLLIDFAVTLRLCCFAQQRMKSGEYSLTVFVGRRKSVEDGGQTTTEKAEN